MHFKVQFSNAPQPHHFPSFNAATLYFHTTSSNLNKHHPHSKKMNWVCFSLVLLIWNHSALAQSGFGVGGGGGVWVGGGGGGGGGIGAGGGVSGPAVSSSLQIAYNALQVWKVAITDDPTSILNTWVGNNVCAYKGVYCADPQDDVISQGLVVAGIDLNKANLQGVLVKELSLISDLSLLHLNSNRFTGTVPYSFRDLYSLQELDLSNNRFSGPFPSVTLLIPNLIYLDIRHNNFSGPVPEDLFNKRLDAIFVNNNQFDGQIPSNLGNTPASVVNLANNKFTGNIPTSFGFMASGLKEILFLNNRLTGCIPEGVGLLSDMEVLDVSYNSLMGHLPDTISCLEEIEILNLAHNKLSGELPDLVCSLKSLMNLTVAYNFFSGFSSDCTKLSYRNVGFDFSDNCIHGRDMQRPQPECSGIPGAGMSCFRIPSVQPPTCGTSMVARP